MRRFITICRENYYKKQEVIDVIKKEMIAMLLAGGQGSRLKVLTEEKCIIKDTPALRDVDVLCKLLESFGAEVTSKLDENIVEIEALISEMMKLENPFTCPHGRPTIITYSKYELERLFKRVMN